jgi:hypothetical protein
MIFAKISFMAKDRLPTSAEIAAEAAAMYPDTNAGPPTPEQIAEEAYAIYQSRGGHHGRDLDDWIEAERRLREKQQRAGSQRLSAVERDAERRGHGADDLKA